jgi:Mg2+ and Co2+ transporter CorA
MLRRFAASSQALPKELNVVLERAMHVEQQIRDRAQMRVAALSLEESRKAIGQCKSLGRLTQLAFLFLPLTFATGVFGMNITPLGVKVQCGSFGLRV